jgi:NitT/TauT family transport system substrate-binding protein
MRTTALGATVGLAAVLCLAACGGGSSASDSSSGGSPQVGIGYFQSATIGSEVLVAGNDDLASKVGGKIKLTPIDSGVAGLAELRGGAFPFVSGVGNPPVVGAIANNTKLKVVYAEYFDAAQLVVPGKITSNDQLAGTTIGDLQGSSEDFEIRGWLENQKLTDKVKVVGFPSEAAVAAAYKSGAITAAYTEIAQVQDLLKDGSSRAVVTAEDIAKLGYPSLNVLAVTDDFASKHKDIVQNTVCQVMRAQTLAKGADADTYITNGAKLSGATADAAIAATKVIPFIPADEELSWFKSDGGDVADGQMAKAYALTADFLKDQGRVTTVPTKQQIADHIDSSYVEQALKDGCGK